jgi:hypothetical protein
LIQEILALNPQCSLYSNSPCILASALGARYRGKVRVSLKIKAADVASEKYRILVYFFHIIILIYNIF